ncbi:MAG: glutathione S-transferase family protein [Methyloligellaceae bacterium]
MAQLVDGIWTDIPRDTKSTGGAYKRKESVYRNWITADGSPGPEGEGGYEAEPDRYHLYVCYACPWAHRTLIFRKLKSLENLISYSACHPLNIEEGWDFSHGSKPDTLNGIKFLHELYTKADPKYTGRVTVPTLWDKKRQTIVNNESSEIIRMFNSAFNDVGASGPDYYPEALRTEIDEVNDRIYQTFNNGVYRSGFATTQEAYEQAVTALFDTLDYLENRLANQRYLVGNQLTEADWRLFPTLIRFDAVYFGHFKCNLRRIVDYPNLIAYTRDLYQVPGIADTVKIDEYKAHYYGSHLSINPTGIIPKGPVLDFSAPHGRENLGSKAA